MKGIQKWMPFLFYLILKTTLISILGKPIIRKLYHLYNEVSTWDKAGILMM